MSKQKTSDSMTSRKKQDKRKTSTNLPAKKLRLDDVLVTPARVDITDGNNNGLHVIARNQNRVYVDSYDEANVLVKFWYKRKDNRDRLERIHDAMDYTGAGNQKYVRINLTGGTDDNGYTRTTKVKRYNNT